MCHAVPIARLGDMEYLPAETGLDAPVTITNTPAVLFAPETIASFEGKPVTIRHPIPASDAFDVTPESWVSVARGVAQNVRPGHGDDADKLVADLLITGSDAIALIRSGVREISCGYASDYVMTGDGTAMRTRIVGNHIAIVESGRAGSDVAIRDEKPEGEPMNEKKTLAEWLKGLLKAADEMPEPEPEKKPEAEPAKDADDPLTAIMARLDAIEAKLAAAEMAEVMEPEEDEKPAEDPMADKCKDAAVIAKAEILAPGIANSATLKVDAIKAAMKTTDGLAAVQAIVDGEIDFENAAAVDAVFNGAAAILAAHRNAELVKTKTVDAAPANHSGVVTADQINAKNAQFWANRER